MEPRTHKQGWGCTHWAILMLVIAGAVSIIIPTIGLTSYKSPQVKATSNCRPIISALKLYAGDHGGAYPDSDPSLPQTANTAFRLLFKEGIVPDERIFGYPESPYKGDNKIGTPPDYAKAIEANENHWMMVTGQSENTSNTIPLVFENTMKAELPLRWDVANAGKPVRGRAWARNKIVVGLNDNSVSVVKLNDDGTPRLELDLPPDAKILDIETAP